MDKHKAILTEGTEEERAIGAIELRNNKIERLWRDCMHGSRGDYRASYQAVGGGGLGGLGHGAASLHGDSGLPGDSGLECGHLCNEIWGPIVSIDIRSPIPTERTG